MQTYTWADVLFQIALNVVGGLALLLFLAIPRYWGLASTWVAKRSKQAADARIASLLKEVERVEEFRSDPAQWNAWMSATLAFLVILVGFALFFAFNGMMLATLIEFRGWVELLDPNIAAHHEATRPVSKVLSRISAIGSLTLMFVTFVTAEALALRLWKFRNLERRRQFLQDQIDRLRARWGTNP
jgi:uncharacterized small protein (DUF1192 family)